MDGRDAVREYWTRQYEAVQSQVEPEEITCAEDGRVMVGVHQVVRSVDGELLADRPSRRAQPSCPDSLA